MEIEQARLIHETLTPRSDRSTSSPPDPDSPSLQRARWVRSQLEQLLKLDAQDRAWAVRAEGFVRGLGETLDSLSEDVESYLTEPDSAALSSDNLGSCLEDGSGILAMQGSISRLIGRLEDSELV